VNRSFPFLFAASRTRRSPFVPLFWPSVQRGLGCPRSPWSTAFLHSLRRRFPAFVRLLRRSYAVVRLPAAVHVGLIAHRVHPPACCRSAPGGNGVSRFSRMEFLCVPGVYDSAGQRRTRPCARHLVAFRFGQHRRLPDCLFRSSIPLPAYAPVNASSAASRSPSHDSDSRWLARPFLTTLSFVTPCRFIPALSARLGVSVVPFPARIASSSCAGELRTGMGRGGRDRGRVVRRSLTPCRSPQSHQVREISA
jgi:hypothetical protein